MASDEEAKAVQEVSKASGKAVDATREVGRFVARFISTPLTTASEIVNDRLRYARWERQQRLMIRAKAFLAEAGLSEPTRQIQLNVAVPLLEAATLEENDDLQDIWANLLINAANANSSVEIRRMYISILQDMSSLDVQCLARIVESSNPQDEEVGGYVDAANLPHDTKPVYQESFPPVPTGDIAITLRNLVRLGCINPLMTMNGMSLRSVEPTELGISLMKACTLHLTR